jgi:hypothetical protein
MARPAAKFYAQSEVQFLSRLNGTLFILSLLPVGNNREAFQIIPFLMFIFLPSLL